MKRPVFREKKCKICGLPYLPTNARQRYCGTDCARRSQQVERECERCGETFLVWKGNIAANKGRFCGVVCSARATALQRGNTLRKERPSKQCPVCDQGFEPRKSIQRYCSRACAAKAHSATRGPKKRPGHDPMRWSLRFKGESECRNCNARAQHLHHLVPRSKSAIGHWDWRRNGVPLCADCHRGWHNRCVTIHADKLHRDELAFVIMVAGPGWAEQNYPDSPLTPVMGQLFPGGPPRRLTLPEQVDLVREAGGIDEAWLLMEKAGIPA